MGSGKSVVSGGFILLDNSKSLSEVGRSREFLLILSNSPKSKGILDVYDLLGNLVQSQILYPKETEVKINLTSKVAGLYTLKIIIDGSIQGYEKIILEN